MHAQSLKGERAYFVRPGADPAFTPHVGALVGMLAYARLTTLQAVEGWPAPLLWQTAPGFSNSAGTLLSHCVAVERTYHCLSFEGRDISAETDRGVYCGLTLGKEGTPPEHLPTLDELLTQVAAARAETVRMLAEKGDAWLSEPLAGGWANHHRAWLHVMEDGVSHRGQLRLPSAGAAMSAEPAAPLALGKPHCAERTVLAGLPCLLELPPCGAFA